MKERIQELEAIARLLDPADSSARKELLDPVIAYANTYLDGISDKPAYVKPSDDNCKDRSKGIEESPIGEERITIEEAINLLEKNVDSLGVNLTSGRHLGYIP